MFLCIRFQKWQVNFIFTFTCLKLLVNFIFTFTFQNYEFFIIKFSSLKLPVILFFTFSSLNVWVNFVFWMIFFKFASQFLFYIFILYIFKSDEPILLSREHLYKFHVNVIFSGTSFKIPSQFHLFFWQLSYPIEMP